MSPDSLKFRPRVPLSDEIISILLYELDSTNEPATFNAVINDKQVE